jgi:4-hydroxythreonine-4-phosphate dehydrogenase
MLKKQCVSITMGDPSGVGPEVIVKALENKAIYNKMTPVLIGNRAVFEQEILKNSSKIRLKSVECPTLGSLRYPEIQIIESDTLRGITKKGKWSKKSGQASFDAVKCATQLAIDKKVSAVVTAPICKEAWYANGINHPGHTELLAKMCKTKDYSMMFVNGPFRVILATIHTPLQKVSEKIKKDIVIRTGITGETTLRKCFGLEKPYIAVAGLNPHAGEGGLIGKEEIKEIIPAIKVLSKRKQLRVIGPIPADTLFYDALQKKYDLILCMYHDQGLIPFKMLALHSGVNVTAGLPIVRTSPDHGTGFDIAKKRIANPGAMLAAIQTAIEMVEKSEKYRKRK